MFNNNNNNKGESKMKTFIIHYTSDIWEKVEVEATSKKEAIDKFDRGDVEFENSVEMGKENLKIDMIEDENGNKL